MMDFDGITSVLEGAFATDGGSISLLLSEADGTKHSLLLTQHLLPPCGCPDERKTGRIYFDGQLIGVRSKEEKALILMLKRAKPDVSPGLSGTSDRQTFSRPGMIVGKDIEDYSARIAEGPESALRYLVGEVLRYVESDEYVSHAEIHER